jgi:hypothetical protein
MEELHCPQTYRPITRVVRKTKGIRPLGRPRRRWESNINMDPNEIHGRIWTGLIYLHVGISDGLLWAC